MRMEISDRFHEMLAGHEEDPETQRKAAELVLGAPDGAERDGLLSLIYHEGLGVERDLDRAFEYAEKAAFEGGDGLGYFMLGYMCENAETPDQAEGGPRQKYDPYDAERFYEICSGIESRWRDQAILWLGDYYMDSAQGGDPEIGVEYYEKIADSNAEAAGRLSDHYWDLIMPEYLEDEEWTSQLYRWTAVAARLDPEEYSYRMGWIYADGLGCEPQPDKAIEEFGKAYSYGDWRGAKSIARVFEEMLDTASDAASRAECEKNIKLWDERADRLREHDNDNDNDK